ncbi:monocarboxylate transporter 6-like [Sitodiplosis mosellana]|uniref:monocarboxylate transporter 6-like n=1 Tax=Sitodiplosis mosellana TaxID=263140 RepID=UPI0024448A8E|nr:monocarboxylate transporter 6-like [Sitodiplosis mosellana]
MGDLTEELKFHTINVAPEGKWGYLVAIGLAIPGACFLGTFASFGLLFNDFLKSIGAGTSAVTTIFGFIAISMSASGLIASSLIRKFSLRSVGLLGAIMYTLGNFLSAFALSVEHLIISFGVFQGFGIGLILNVGYTNFNYYFVKRRVFMMSVTQVLKGLLVAAYPIVIRFLVEKYGFRGATAIIAAIHAHTIVGMMAMHPIEWHCKVIRIPVEESKPLMNTNEKESEVIITVVPDDETKGKLASTYRSSEQDLHEKTKNSDSGTQLIRSERSKSIDVTQTLDGFDPITKRISSIMSFGDLGGAVIMAETSNNKNGKWYTL